MSECHMKKKIQEEESWKQRNNLLTPALKKKIGNTNNWPEALAPL